MSPGSKPSGQLWTCHISGQTQAGRRSTLVNIFGNLSTDSLGVLSNCACLGEGVDVPVLDGVAFIDPKRSMIDIIQGVAA
jgi:predicted helicase